MVDPNPHAPEQPDRRVLCVDLDGTLLATDSLQESLLLLARHRPLYLLCLPAWAARGRAHAKQRLAQCVLPDPALLPYREPVLAYVRQQKELGRPIALATGADRQIADRVQNHLGLFDVVLASDGVTNLTGQAKLEAMNEHFGPGGFTYVGDNRKDLPIWKATGHALVTGSMARRADAISRHSLIERVFAVPRPGLGTILRAMRAHQWVKNTLLFVPLILSHRLDDLGAILIALASFAAFSLCCSGVYLVNDLLDLNSDRKHAHTRRRPLASGQMNLTTGLLLAVGAMVSAAAISVAVLPKYFLLVLAGYIVLAMFYSLYLNQKMLIDVIFLVGFYAYRVLAGAAAISVTVSPWFMTFAIFFFLNLALLKRYADLVELKEHAGSLITGRAYEVDDMELMRAIGPASGLVSVLVLALYTNSEKVATMYHRSYFLWLMCPCLLYWILRIWFIAHRGAMHHDPIVFALGDRVSYLVGAMLVLLLALAWL